MVVQIEELEAPIEVTVKTNNAEGNIKKFARDVQKELDPVLLQKLELDVAWLQLSLSKSRKLLRDAKKSWDRDATLEAQLKTNRLSSDLTEAKRQLRNYVNTWDKDLSRLQTKFNQLWDWAKKMWEQLKKALVAVWAIAGIQAVAKWVITLAGNLEQARIAFTTMLGSAEQADIKLKELSAFAAKTPFELTGIRQNAKQLLAMGIASDDLLPTLKSLWDVSAWLSVPLERLALNYGQVIAQGKLTGRELRDFTVAWVPILAELAKNLGKTKQEIQGLISSWEISSNDVVKAFQTMSDEWGRFANLMDKQANTLQGAFSNLQDSVNILWEEVGMIFIPFLTKIVKAMWPVIEAIWNFAKQNPKLSASLFAVAVAWWAVAAAISLIWWPITAVVAWIWLLAGATGWFISVVNWWRKEVNGFRDDLGELKEEIEKNKKAQDDLEKAFKNWTMSLVEYNNKLNELQEEQARLTEEADKAVLSLEDIKESYDNINKTWITTENERAELALLREEALRTRNELNKLIKTIQDNFKKSKKEFENQKAETESWVRSLVWVGADAWFAWQQFLSDIAALNQAQWELQWVEDVINWIWISLWDTSEEAKDTEDSLEDLWWWASKSIEKLQDKYKRLKWELDETIIWSQEFYDKQLEIVEVEEEISKLGKTYWELQEEIKETTEETAKLKEEAKDTFEKWINEQIANTEDKIKSLIWEIQDLNDELGKIGEEKDQDIADRVVSIDVELEEARKKIEEFNQAIASSDWSDYQDIVDLQKDIAEQQQIINDLTTEKWEAFAWLSSEEADWLRELIEEQQKYNDLTEIGKIKEDYATQKAEIEADLVVKQDALLAEQEAIIQFQTIKNTLLEQGKIKEFKIANELIAKWNAVARARELWLWGSFGWVSWGWWDWGWWDNIGGDSINTYNINVNWSWLSQSELTQAIQDALNWFNP